MHWIHQSRANACKLVRRDFCLHTGAILSRCSSSQRDHHTVFTQVTGEKIHCMKHWTSDASKISISIQNVIYLALILRKLQDVHDIKSDLRAKTFQPLTAVRLLHAILNTDGAAIWRASAALQRMWSCFSAHAALATNDNQSSTCCLMPHNKQRCYDNGSDSGTLYSSHNDQVRTINFPFLPRPWQIGGRGIIFDRFLCLYLCFFVSKITRKQLDRFAWNFQGRCGVTMGRPGYIFGQFQKNLRCRDVQHGDGVCLVNFQSRSRLGRVPQKWTYWSATFTDLMASTNSITTVTMVMLHAVMFTKFHWPCQVIFAQFPFFNNDGSSVPQLILSIITM